MNYRNPYSDQERKAIVRYIVTNERYNEVKGVKLWMEMEQEKVVERTWQSIKEHFRKKIVFDLRHYKLTPAQKTLLLHGARGISPLKKLKTRKGLPEKDFNINDFPSSDEESKPVNKPKLKRKLEVEFSDSDSDPKNYSKVKFLKRKSKLKSSTGAATSVSVQVHLTDTDETDYEPGNSTLTKSSSMDFLSPSQHNGQTKKQIFADILQGLETGDSCKIRSNIYSFIVKSMSRILQGKDRPVTGKNKTQFETLSSLAFKKLAERCIFEVGNIFSETIVRELSEMMKSQK